jgi:hypothetical protein
MRWWSCAPGSRTTRLTCGNPAIPSIWARIGRPTTAGGRGCRMKTHYGVLAAAAITGVLWSHDALAQDVYCGPPPSGSTTRITSDVFGDVKVVGECTIISEPDDMIVVQGNVESAAPVIPRLTICGVNVKGDVIVTEAGRGGLQLGGHGCGPCKDLAFNEVCNLIEGDVLIKNTFSAFTDIERNSVNGNLVLDLNKNSLLVNFNHVFQDLKIASRYPGFLNVTGNAVSGDIQCLISPTSDSPDGQCDDDTSSLTCDYAGISSCFVTDCDDDTGECNTTELTVTDYCECVSVCGAPPECVD